MGPARGKIREMHGIEGSCCGDWFITCCCGALALCQVLGEKSAGASYALCASAPQRCHVCFSLLSDGT